MKKLALLLVLCCALLADEDVTSLLDAYQNNPNDVEPLAKIASSYRYQGKHNLAYIFAKLGADKCDDYRFQQELSISAFYAGHKEEAFHAACKLVLQKNIPWNYKNQTYCNMQFYAHPLKSARYLAISPELPKGYLPMNPAIQKYEKGYEVVCRGVNYTQVGAIQFNTTDPDHIFRSKNYLMQFDQDFKLISQVEIVESVARKKDLTHYSASHTVGFEDCRLFTWKGKDWFTSCVRDTDHTGLPKIVLCGLEGGEVKRFIPLLGPDVERCERNWLPLVKGGELYMIYMCNPFILYKPNLETGECDTVLKYVTYNYDFTHFRGSAAPISFDGGYLMLTHEIGYDGNGARTYYHRFVFMDKDFLIKSMSKPFIYRHFGIEFCGGMTIDHSGKELIMAVGMEDKEAYFCIVDLSTVKELLEPIDLETSLVESMIGFGTYPLTGKTCTEAVKTAIGSGYRMIDTATMYGNFDAIAKAIKGEDRSSLYIISKVWHDQQSPENLKKDLERTLKELQIDYLDAYLVHWPNSKIPIEKTLKAMEELRKEKKIRHIGLSNVTVNHLKRALEVGVPITWVQVEMHPEFYDAELLEFCKMHSIKVQAWAPLGRGKIAKDELLNKMGKKYDKTAAQVALRWILQHDVMPLPASTNEKHMRENLAAEDFSLSKEDMAAIDARAKSGHRERFNISTIGFNDEFDFPYEQCWPK